MSKDVFERVKINVKNLNKREINEENNDIRFGIRRKNDFVYRAGFKPKIIINKIGRRVYFPCF